jgi:hypothetical protein
MDEKYGLNIIDLFCGIGGFRVGFEKALSKYNKDMKGFKPKKLKKKYVDFGDDNSTVSSYSSKKQPKQIDDKDEIKNILSEMTHHIENEDKKQAQKKYIQTKAAEKIQKAWKLGVKPKQTIAAEAKAEEKAEAKAEDKKTSDIKFKFLLNLQIHKI